MEIIGKIIADILKNSKNKKIADQMKKQVSKITQKFPYFK